MIVRLQRRTYSCLVLSLTALRGVRTFRTILQSFPTPPHTSSISCALFPQRPPQTPINQYFFQTYPSSSIRTLRIQLYSSSSTPSSTTSENDEVDISSMRAKDMKAELEGYGISTKSFLEKSELMAALQKARKDGSKQQQPIHSSSSTTTTTSSSTTTASGNSSRKNSNTTTDPYPEKEKDTTTSTRQERLEKELEQCRSMKASELQKELRERGINTKALLEKKEFVQALAEARVDNIVQQSNTKKKNDNDDEEGYAEYNNVEVLTDDTSGPRSKNIGQEVSQQSGGGNPFGGGGVGGGNPFGGMGGMGGMGGIADMLKNMGVGGASSAPSPFGGGGGGASGNPFGSNPFGGGDVMGKAQQMMSNPKVREIIQKAQSNPETMKKVNECMSNPMAFMKYQNDPDVAELLSEFKKYM